MSDDPERMESGGLSGMHTARLSVQKVGYTMDTRKHMLIAIDRSGASLRAVAYVAAMIGQRGFQIELLHVLPPLQTLYQRSIGR